MCQIASISRAMEDRSKNNRNEDEMSEAYIKSIESCIECFQGSHTEANYEFVEGVIYGLGIAKAIINGIAEHERTE